MRVLIALQVLVCRAAVRGATRGLKVPALSPAELSEGTLDEGQSCYDKSAQWQDLQGDSCLDYQKQGYCDRDSGVFFGFKTVIWLLHRLQNDSPSDVCCACGGGIIKTCDEACRALKQREVSNVQYAFDAMAEEMRHAVASTGAARVTKVAQDMEVSRKMASEKVQQHSQKQLSEELRGEERSFELLTEEAAFNPRKAAAELESFAANSTAQVLQRSLETLDRTQLTDAGHEALSKFQTAEEAWDAAHEKAKKAEIQSNATHEASARHLTEAMSRLARDFQLVEESRGNFSGVHLEAQGAEEEVLLASQMALELREKSQGVKSTLESIKRISAEAEASKKGEQLEDTSEQLEDNEQTLNRVRQLVQQAEAFKG